MYINWFLLRFVCGFLVFDNIVYFLREIFFYLFWLEFFIFYGLKLGVLVLVLVVVVVMNFKVYLFDEVRCIVVVVGFG